MAFVRVASLPDLWRGEMTACSVSGRSVLLVRLDEGVFAYENRCAHQGMPLHQGRLDGVVLTCPIHEWTYDARTGTGKNPAKACLRRFATRVEGDEIFVDVEAAS